MAAKHDKQQQHANRRRFSLWGLLFRGQLIDSDFFARNWLIIAATVVLALAYITNKYSCQTLMEEERRLREQLEIVKTERIRVRSVYMGRIRESSMRELVDSLQLGLNVQNRPPFKLSKKE